MAPGAVCLTVQTQRTAKKSVSTTNQVYLGPSLPELTPGEVPAPRQRLWKQELGEPPGNQPVASGESLRRAAE